MKRKGLAMQSWLITSVLGALISILPAQAQSQSQVPDRDNDLNRQQLAAFDQFLDGHREVADQLRKDPSLVNNDEFMENHPDLQNYLQQHPEVRESLSRNPNLVMEQEQHFDRREDARGDQDRDRDRDRDGDRRMGDSDINRRELANMDQFMDRHPEIAEQLRKDPSLVNNKQFVSNHPELQEFLANHPELREEYKENPNAFMHREERYDRREDQSRNWRDNDVTRGELANMDRFMDGHPEIAEQLRKDPSLVDNKQFVASHPELQEFLANHPGVREEYKENPNAFMRQEERYDRRQDFKRGDRDVTGGELSSFHEFLESHNAISTELSQHPWRATDEEYLEKHPELQTYLKDHPGVHEELGEHPEAFLKSAQQFQNPTRPLPKPITDPKLK